MAGPREMRSRAVRTAPLDYPAYRAMRYFASLDGVRAISILLVISTHTVGPLFRPLAGWLGVEIFFVISGYLITTLCLREEEDRGRVCLRAFYVRRAYRILPIYYLTLVVFFVAVVVLHLYGGDARTFVSALPHYILFFNDGAPITPLKHSWSLGVEQKFYLLWPLLAFLLWKGSVQKRLAGTALLAVGLLFVSAGRWLTPLHAYGAILTGCLLAVLLHRPKSFHDLAVLAVRPWSTIALGVFLVLHVARGVVPSDGYLLFQAIEDFVYPWVVAAVLVPVLLCEAGWVRLLRAKWLVSIGVVSYGLYLLHPLVAPAAVRVIPGTLNPVVSSAVTFVLVSACSIGLASVAHVWLERPLIARGRVRSRRLLARDRSDHTSSGSA